MKYIPLAFLGLVLSLSSCGEQGGDNTITGVRAGGTSTAGEGIESSDELPPQDRK